MTGYGHFEDTVNMRKISAEIRSVNHRYTDFTVKVPRQYGFLEDVLRKEASEIVKRGKVDIYLSIVDYSEDSVMVSANKELAKSYLNELKSLSEVLGVENNVTVTDIARFPDMFKVDKPPVDEEELTADVLAVFRKALSLYDKMRKEEGARLGTDLLEKGRVIVEGANMVTKAQKPQPAAGIQGGLIKLEAPIDSSNVMIICPACEKATRVEMKVIDSKKVRVCKKCGEQLDA